MRSILFRIQRKSATPTILRNWSDRLRSAGGGTRSWYPFHHLPSFVRTPSLPLPAHVLFLLITAATAFFFYLLPTLLVGYPHDIAPLLLARNFGATGLFSLTDGLGSFLSTENIRVLGVPSAADGRLSAVIFAQFSRWITWGNLLGWAGVSAGLTALALIPWWFAVRRLADVRTAWIATVVFALLPLTWKQALFLENYHVAVLFLFFSLASFVCLFPRRPLAALLFSGAFFGLSAAAKDVFLIFVPWLVCGYLWEHRAQWKRTLLGVLLFAAAAGGMYLLPYARDIRTLGYPANQNLARVWPGAQDMGNEIYLHLYPDPYTYFSDRTAFERRLLDGLSGLTPLERLQKEKILLNFSIGQQSILRSFGNGFWLFLGAIPSFFHQATVGGVVLWLFLIPGFFTVWRRERRLAIHAVGLVASAFFVISFVLHFSREHLMDISWVLAFFAAVGIAAVSDALARVWKKVSALQLSAAITVVVALHFLQVDRIETGRLFRASAVPRTLAIVAALGTLPADAAVAIPGHANPAQQYALLSNRTITLFQEETIGRLLGDGKLREAFQLYGITHAALYPPALAQRMRTAVPGLVLVSAESIPGLHGQKPSAFLRWLLHILR